MEKLTYVTFMKALNRLLTLHELPTTWFEVNCFVKKKTERILLIKFDQQPISNDNVSMVKLSAAYYPFLSQQGNKNKSCFCQLECTIMSIIS